MQRPDVVNICLKPIIISGVVVRDKAFLRMLEKILELHWLHGKNHQTKKSLIEYTLSCLASVAVENNDLSSLQALLEEVDVNFANYDGIRPLHTACELGNSDMATFLLGKGASPELVNCFGKCALHMAIINRHYQVIMILQKNGFTVNLHPVRIAMEMIQAVQNRDYPLLHAWSLSGVDMDTKDYNGFTVMHEAVALRDKAMISKLLKYGATPLERNVWGQTAMDDARNEPAIIALFNLYFYFPTKEAYLEFNAKY